MAEKDFDDGDAPKAPLFSLDLGANGGLFAPTTVEEVHVWVEREYNAWSWTQSINAGEHRNLLDHAFQAFNVAINAVREARQFEAQSNESAVRDRLSSVKEQMQTAFVTRAFPHSTSTLGHRVLALKEDDPFAAIGYLFPFLPGLGQTYRFDARELGSWRGFVMGLNERFGLDSTGGEPAIRAQRDALEKLHERAETLFGEKRLAYDGLHRDFATVLNQVRQTGNEQTHSFDEFMSKVEAEHSESRKKHDEGMEAVRAAYQEGMTLRAPVDYWQKKAESHSDRSTSYMKWAFGSMAAVGAFIASGTWWAMSSMKDDKPDAWKFAVVVLLGVIGIWAVRLVVRMFLSHSHLATDAEERVTMVKTYLSLIEAGKMPSDDDRKLVLAPMFRPATDGLVKDEGLPHPMLELLTRSAAK
ncbi:DUF6161 domain-containing protein [Variovorax saccharolyticus]|uniref:DUF6161 domain-containing protein n=1 Tax=Variovorax saccharolyticus TaxID=3053516 RepID=UPI00257838FB|nr:DUF6161 domain-containing protein [Variovorax sp. J31P216]MDM0028383.1 DUF6161 domain-containing protein [Variovorax sp. J31P216]